MSNAINATAHTASVTAAFYADNATARDVLEALIVEEDAYLEISDFGAANEVRRAFKWVWEPTCRTIGI